jgi:putative ABC transport system substrate-binding protein
VRTLVCAILVLGLLAAPLASGAQQAPHAPARIGYLGNSSFKTQGEQLEAFRWGLRDWGWIEGQTLVIEYRWAEGKPERLPALAAELVQLGSDVIVVAGIQGIEAARRATSSVPIVIGALLVDPVSFGYAASLARPGGNITGLASEYETIVTAP